MQKTKPNQKDSGKVTINEMKSLLKNTTTPKAIIIDKTIELNDPPSVQELPDSMEAKKSALNTALAQRQKDKSILLDALNMALARLIPLMGTKFDQDLNNYHAAHKAQAKITGAIQLINMLN